MLRTTEHRTRAALDVAHWRPVTEEGRRAYKLFASKGAGWCAMYPCWAAPWAHSCTGLLCCASSLMRDALAAGPALGKYGVMGETFLEQGAHRDAVVVIAVTTARGSQQERCPAAAQRRPALVERCGLKRCDKLPCPCRSDDGAVVVELVMSCKRGHSAKHADCGLVFLGQLSCDAMPQQRGHQLYVIEHRQAC